MFHLQQLDWDGDDDYYNAIRYGWMVEGEIAGYGKSAGLFTELLLRNAGHMAPADQPKWAYLMYKTFINNESFDNYVKKEKKSGHHGKCKKKFMKKLFKNRLPVPEEETE